MTKFWDGLWKKEQKFYNSGEGACQCFLERIRPSTTDR